MLLPVRERNRLGLKPGMELEIAERGGLLVAQQERATAIITTDREGFKRLRKPLKFEYEKRIHDDVLK